MIRMISAGMSFVLFVTLSLPGARVARAGGDPAEEFRSLLSQARSQGVVIEEERGGAVRTQVSGRHAIRFAPRMEGQPSLEVGLVDTASGQVVDAVELLLPSGEQDAAAFQLSLSRALSGFSERISASENLLPAAQASLGKDILKYAGWTLVVIGGAVFAFGIYIGIVANRSNPHAFGYWLLGGAAFLVLGGIGWGLLALSK